MFWKNTNKYTIHCLIWNPYWHFLTKKSCLPFGISYSTSVRVYSWQLWRLFLSHRRKTLHKNCLRDPLKIEGTGAVLKQSSQNQLWILLSLFHSPLYIPLLSFLIYIFISRFTVEITKTRICAHSESHYKGGGNDPSWGSFEHGLGESETPQEGCEL